MTKKNKNPFNKWNMTWNGHKIVSTAVADATHYVTIQVKRQNAHVVAQDGESIFHESYAISREVFTQITDILLRPARDDLWHLPTRKGAILAALSPLDTNVEVLGSTCLLRENRTNYRLLAVRQRDEQILIVAISPRFPWDVLFVNNRKWEIEHEYFELPHLRRLNYGTYPANFDWETLLKQKQQSYAVRPFIASDGLQLYVPFKMDTIAHEIYSRHLPEHIVNILIKADVHPMEFACLGLEGTRSIFGIGEKRYREIAQVWGPIWSMIHKIGDARDWSEALETLENGGLYPEKA